MRKIFVAKSQSLFKRGCECISIMHSKWQNMLRFRRLSGFSLGDALIAMAVIGALALILLPSYKAVNPDKSEALHKKATLIVDRVVYELVSDE